MKEEFVFSAQGGESLNELLRRALPGVLRGGEASNSKIRRLIFSQNVFVRPSGGGDFFACKNPSFILKKSALVRVFLDQEKFFFQKQNGDIAFELDGSRVLYEDDYLIAVNKPPHFPCEAAFVQDRDNMRAAAVRYLHKKIGLEKNPPYCGLVHRLDRDTSGVLLLSKSRAANAALFAAFDGSGAESGGTRGAKKIYAAICSRGGTDSARLGLLETFGRADAFEKNAPFCRTDGSRGTARALDVAKARGFEIDSGGGFSVKNYLGRVSPKSQAAKWGLVPKEKGGKFARTDFSILQEKGGLFFVQAELFTGRAHQIRVHLSQAGLPVLGDRLYGGADAERIFLHARSLELSHPMTGQRLKIEAPLPEEFASCF